MSHHVLIASAILVGLVVGIGPQFFSGEAEVVPQSSHYIHASSSPETISATAYVVFDAATGEVLLREQETEILPIASITKLFSAAVFRQMSDLQATHTVTYADVLSEGRAGKLQAGDIYAGRELLFPLLLESSNDAAVTLARVEPALLPEISTYIHELNLASTSIADTSGLSAQNVSTATDLGQFLRHLRDTQPYILDNTRVPEYYSVDNGWFNNSPFITDPDYRGGKHGFTYEANRTAAVLFNEVFSADERVVGYVLLGSDDLVADMDTLRRFVSQQIDYR